MTLAGKNISKMTYFVLSGMLSLAQSECELCTVKLTTVLCFLKRFFTQQWLLKQSFSQSKLFM